MRVLPAALIILTTATGGPSALAQQYLGNCNANSAKLSEAKQKMGDGARLQAMSEIVTEVQLLEKTRLKKSDIPQSFLSECLVRKIAILDTHKELASNTLKASPGFNVVLGDFFVIEDLRDTALTYYNRALTAAPDDVKTLNKAFHNWLELWKVKRAQEVVKFKAESARYLDAIEKNPNASAELKVSLFLVRAEWFKKYQAYADALEDYKRILKIDAHNVSALREVAEDAFRRKNLDEARGHYENLSKYPSERLNARDQLATIDENQGRLPEALSTIQILLKATPQDLGLRLRRARLLFKMERVDESITATKALVPLAQNATNEMKNELADLLSLQAKQRNGGLDLLEYSAELATGTSKYRHLYITEFMRQPHRNLLSDPRKAKVLQVAVSLLGQQEWPNDELENLAELSVESQSWTEAARFCREIENLFAIPARYAVLTGCVRSYLKTNQKKAAKALLDKAFLDSKYTAYRDQIRNQIAAL